VVLEFASSSDQTGSSGGDQTTLLSSWGVSSGGSWVTNVLMVTTTMGMLDWVHGNTSNSWPVSLLGVRFVVGCVGLEEWLVGSLSSCDDTDHSSAATEDGLSHTRWHSDSSLGSIFGVTDDDSASSRGTGEGAAITNLCLNVRNDGSFWHLVDWENVADGEGRFSTRIDELTGVHALDSDEILSVLLVFVLVSENDFGKRCATARIVNDVLHNSLDVSFPLSEVQCSESGWGDSLRGVGLEDRARSTSLHSDLSSHDANSIS